MGPEERKTKDIVWYTSVDDRVGKPLPPIGDLDEFIRKTLAEPFYTDMSIRQIIDKMKELLHAEKAKVRYGMWHDEDWVWEVSKDVRDKLERPVIIMGIGVRTVPTVLNHIELIKREKENAMNNLFATNKATLEVNGQKYAVRINTVDMRPDELTRLTCDVLGLHYYITPRHAGYSAHSFFMDELHWAAQRSANIPGIKKVMFEDPATIVFWKDGTKTVVRAQDEEFDPEKGLAMAISRKALGNQRDYYNVFLKWLKKFKKKEEKKAEHVCLNCNHYKTEPSEAPCHKCDNHSEWEEHPWCC